MVAKWCRNEILFFGSVYSVVYLEHDEGCVEESFGGVVGGITDSFLHSELFLITVSGEDIFQGAGTAPDVWKDLREAFLHNARIPDMYAWAVINF